MFCTFISIINGSNQSALEIFQESSATTVFDNHSTVGSHSATKSNQP